MDHRYNGGSTVLLGGIIHHKFSLCILEGDLLPLTYVKVSHREESRGRMVAHKC